MTEQSFSMFLQQDDEDMDYSRLGWNFDTYLEHAAFSSTASGSSSSPGLFRASVSSACRTFASLPGPGEINGLLPPDEYLSRFEAMLPAPDEHTSRYEAMFLPPDEYMSRDEAKEGERRTCPYCGKNFTDLKAHMLTHQTHLLDKCPIHGCRYHARGFASKYNMTRHTLTHFKGTLVCGFCPGSGSAAERSFNRADVFKRHLTTVHGVEQKPPGSRRKAHIDPKGTLAGYAADATGNCSTCSQAFPNAQIFYEHLDECILGTIRQRSTASWDNDSSIGHSLDKGGLTAAAPLVRAISDKEQDGDGMEDKKDCSDVLPFKKKSSFVDGVSRPHRITRSLGGVPLVSKGRGGGHHRGYPSSWGLNKDKMATRKRTMSVFDNRPRRDKINQMLRTDRELYLKRSDGKPNATDLDRQTMKRAEGFLSDTKENKNRWIYDDFPEEEMRNVQKLMQELEAQGTLDEDSSHQCGTEEEEARPPPTSSPNGQLAPVSDSDANHCFGYDATGSLCLGSDLVRPGTSASPSLASLDSNDESLLFYIDASEFIPEAIQEEALTKLLNDFAISRGASSFTQYVAESTRPRESSGETSSASTSEANNAQASARPSKRKYGNGCVEDEDQGGRRRKKCPNDDNAPASGDESRLLFACPFYKCAPLKYRSCQSKVLKEISRVKLHLWRCHAVPIYCPRCFAGFDTETERNEHLRPASGQMCPQRDEAEMTWDGMSAEQKRALEKRVDRRQSRRDQWYQVYRILFPNQRVPDSPYMADSLLSHELSLLRDFMTREWPREFGQFVDTRLPAELRDHKEMLQEFSAGLFEEAVSRIMQRFEEQSHGNQSPDSAYMSNPSSALTDPNAETVSPSSASSQQLLLPLAAEPMAGVETCETENPTSQQPFDSDFPAFDLDAWVVVGDNWDID